MESLFVNAHTHNALASDESISIINLEPDSEIPQKGFFSIGIHPWSLDKDTQNIEGQLLLIGRQAEKENVLAIGEVGLDKLHRATFDKQITLFERQILISEKARKPIIMHAVKSNAEILSLRKKLKAKETWIMHGFNGTVEDAQQLTENGVMLSVGESIFFSERKIHKTLKSISLNTLFLETDMSTYPIEEIYEKASEITGQPLSVLRDRIFANFARTFLKQ